MNTECLVPARATKMHIFLFGNSSMAECFQLKYYYLLFHLL